MSPSGPWPQHLLCCLKGLPGRAALAEAVVHSGIVRLLCDAVMLGPGRALQAALQSHALAQLAFQGRGVSLSEKSVLVVPSGKDSSLNGCAGLSG